MTQTEFTDLAAKRRPFDGESDTYAEARQNLLSEEIALQYQIDKVAEQRRILPFGPIIKKDYQFTDMNGNKVGLAELFGDHDTLVAYSWMYGPNRLPYVHQFTRTPGCQCKRSDAACCAGGPRPEHR